MKFEHNETCGDDFQIEVKALTNSSKVFKEG